MRQRLSLNSLNKLLPLAKQISRELRANPTIAESVLWCNLRYKKVGGRRFLRQYPIFYDIIGKESFFIPDFYCHECRLAIELDGHYHNFRLKQDNQRTLILNQLGITVLRFANDDVLNNMPKVLLDIAAEIERYPSPG